MTQTTTFEMLWNEYRHVAEGVAYQFGGSNRKYGAEPADFLQEFVAWMLENEQSLAYQAESMSDEDFTRYLARCLENEAKDYSTDIKAQALGYERRDLFFYSKNELKYLLDCMFDRDKWLDPPQSEGRSVKSPAEGGNWLATLADVAQAYEKLDTADRLLLRQFHDPEFGYMNRELAEQYGVTEATMSARHTRSINRLLKKLGGSAPRPAREGDSRDPWRGRKAISNSAARALTSHQYQED